MILDLRSHSEIPDLNALFQRASTCLLLWKIPASLPNPAESFLSGAELKKWTSQTIFERQHQFLASRYYTKTLLAPFLGTEPSSFDFDLRGEGKLFLPSQFSSANVDFNFSHSKDLFLLGVSRSHQIGVDIEAKAPRENMLQVAERIFSVDERRWMNSSKDRFFRLWSSKEAVLKTVGGGVFKHVQNLELICEGEILKIKKLPQGFGSANSWQLFENSLPDFACAWALKNRT